MQKVKNRKFERMQDEAIKCDECDGAGRDLRNRLFGNTVPPICLKCGGWGVLDIQTGEAFSDDDQLRAGLMIRDYWYLLSKRQVQESKELIEMRRLLRSFKALEETIAAEEDCPYYPKAGRLRKEYVGD